MSSWTYVTGQVTVAPSGSGNHAKRFVLEEVLDHLPRVYGSEGPMTWHVVKRHGHDGSCNYDEFGMKTNLSERGWWGIQSTYIIVLEGRLRDTFYEDTLRSFTKWLSRLSKRVWIEDVLVRVTGYSLQRGFWHEYLFNGADNWRANYWADVRVGTGRLDNLSRRRSVNLRYGFAPRDGFWPDILVNLVPGGEKLAHDWDLLVGNAEPEEYLDWNPKTDDYDGVDPDILKFVEEGRKKVEDVHASLNDGRVWPGVDGGDES